jgi:hypothetical protein
MAPRKVPIQIAPGVLKSQSDYASPGRYIDMDKVRFDEGLPEKIGGWEATGWSTVTGVPRSALAWRDNSSNFRLATGSALKVETLDNDGDELTDITPVRASGTLGTDPFTMTSGSVVVSVASTGHTLEQGDYVIFENATAAGGITIDGEYTVLDVTDPDNFTITHSADATSSTSGGGSSVDYTYSPQQWRSEYHGRRWLGRRDLRQRHLWHGTHRRLLPAACGALGVRYVWRRLAGYEE